MTKLRTLEDTHWNLAVGAWGEATDVINKELLRSVAKEWIKELNDAMYIFESDNEWIEKWIEETSHRGSWGRDALTEWIKYFFNLED